MTKPSAAEQQARHDAKFRRIVDSFRNLQSSVDGMDPEQVIVIETIGASIDGLARAAAQVEGLEWLTEIELEDADPCDGFADEEDPTRQLPRRLYALMSNQQAMNELVALWTNWAASPAARARHNFGPFKSVFIHLWDVRRWGVRDRIQETRVVRYWEERLQDTKRNVRFEVELWCRGDSTRREAGYQNLRRLIESAGGQCISRALIPEILYFGVLAELPADRIRKTIDAIVDESYSELLRCEDVMFFRPHAQSVFPGPESPAADECSPKAGQAPLPSGEPVIALIDGMPLSKHSLLAGRLTIDDEDDHASRYESHQRQHGTAMASLIIWGDMSASGPPLPRPVYVRPVLLPYVDLRGNVEERTPDDKLLLDIIHRAALRIKGHAGKTGEAPGVKVINVSIGNSWQPFFRHLSPLARLLDWLAWKYQILFLVSAGNQGQSIEPRLTVAELPAATDDQFVARTLEALHHDQVCRRPFSPAEAINVVTVGALHADGSTWPGTDRRVDLLRGQRLPSPLNPVAAGFNRAVKPDVLFPGGRQLYLQHMATEPPLRFNLAHSTLAPGVCIASPGQRPMELNRTIFSRGTSNATALATRTAGLVHERLVELRSKPGGERMTDEYIGVILKTLLVHGASWGKAAEILDRVFGGTVTDWREMLRLKCRFLGYGEVDPDRCMFSTEKRVLMLGWDKLACKEAHVYDVPLPPALSGKPVKRRLTVSLGWFSPLNPWHKDYRRAFLWFAPPEKDQLGIEKTDLDAESSRRGTIQHQVFEGEKSRGFTDGDTLRIKVSCANDAGLLTEQVPYAVAVTLEIAAPIDLKIYKEVEARIRPTVGVKPKG